MIVVCGPESSGTKMVTRILRQAGGEVIHRAFPHGGARAGRPDSGVWPDLREEPVLAVAVVMVRDLRSVVRSQVECRHVLTDDQAHAHIRRAYLAIFSALADLNLPFRVVSFESLLQPEAVTDLCSWLGLDPAKVTTTVEDANAKWYGGPAFSDRSALQPRLLPLLSA